jgi:hypothetical protein
VRHIILYALNVLMVHLIVYAIVNVVANVSWGERLMEHPNHCHGHHHYEYHDHRHCCWEHH